MHKKKTKKKKNAKGAGRKPFKMTGQHRDFCKQYIIHFDGQKAAMAVGDFKNKNSAGVVANKWLKHPAIQKYLAKIIAKRQERLDVKGDEAMIECRRIALADVADAFNEDGSLKDIQDIPEDLRRCISGFEVLEVYEGTGKNKVYVGKLKKMKFWNKVTSLDMLFKHHGLFELDNEQSKTKPVTIVHFGKINDTK